MPKDVKVSQKAERSADADAVAEKPKKKEQAHETGTAPLYRIVGLLVNSQRYIDKVIAKNPRTATKALNMLTKKATQRCMDVVREIYTEVGYEEAFQDAIKEGHTACDRQEATNQAKQKQLSEAREKKKEKDGAKSKGKEKAAPKPKRQPKFIQDEVSESLDSESDESDSMDESEESE